jgi:formylglycine-generating enzyme required for sulfatase activity
MEESMEAQDIRQQVATGPELVEFQVAAIRFELVKIKPGRFHMGSTPTEEGHQSNEGPRREIEISKPFYLGRYQITQAQYITIIGASPSDFVGDSVPVDQIVYPKALQFCERLTQLVSVSIALPTEAQWEYACRAGSKTRFCSGETTADLNKVAWYEDNAGGTIHPVGQKEPNPWGLYDMHGNVWELCSDFLDPYDRISPRDPKGATSKIRGAMRGGGWTHGANYCRSASRLVSDTMFGGAGIRIAINP